MKVLLAEDEKELSRAETAILKINGFEVDPAYDGAEAEEKIFNNSYDVIVLDVMMPEKDGIEVLRDIRAAGVVTPVIMLTAKAEVDDRVLGLDAGADDYLTKPFAMKELVARIKSQVRRSGSFTPTELNVGGLHLNVADQMIRAENSIRLSGRETKLLEYLMLNKDRKLSSEDIFSHVWPEEENDASDKVYVYVSYLRQKLEAIGSSVRIDGEKGGSYGLAGEQAS